VAKDTIGFSVEFELETFVVVPIEHHANEPLPLGTKET
jgi:hypothetical protein